jgi:uncharacterized membrane protein YfcA
MEGPTPVSALIHAATPLIVAILAVPLLVYLVGVPSAHMAIGTSAVAVAINAATSVIRHARAGNVRWPCASVFATAGVAGAFAGSSCTRTVPSEVFRATTGPFAVAAAAGVREARARFRGEAAATLIGLGCPACTRSDCPQRSAPPAGRVLVFNERERGLSPFAFDQQV